MKLYWLGWSLGVAGCVLGMVAAERWLRQLDRDVMAAMS